MPLPDKRDTLGIFLFPWGETSDNAVYQPAVYTDNILSAPVPSVNWSIDPSRQRIEPTDSSFFDDYDEQDDYDDLKDGENFDEATLCEISSLLQTKYAPLRESLLPPPQQATASFKYYDDEVVLAPGPKTESQVSYAANESLGYIHSPSLLLPTKQAELSPEHGSPSETAGPIVDPLRVSTSSSRKALFTKPAASAIPSHQMWTPQRNKVEPYTSSLFSLNVERSIFCTTNASTAVGAPIKRRQASSNQAPSLKSQKLWSQEQNSNHMVEWIWKSTIPYDMARLDCGSPIMNRPMLWAPTTKAKAADDTTVPLSQQQD